MPQLIFLAILVGGGWYLYKRFVTEAQKITARAREREREQKTGAMGTLVQDPVTGEYRVKQDDQG
jgi:membrane protein implicated in regulation of membrane protease activity